jgi:hypothetical protein
MASLTDPELALLERFKLFAKVKVCRDDLITVAFTTCCLIGFFVRPTASFFFVLTALLLLFAATSIKSHAETGIRSREGGKKKSGRQ